jgi:preprotein translocase subunit YajC
VVSPFHSDEYEKEVSTPWQIPSCEETRLILIVIFPLLILANAIWFHRVIGSLDYMNLSGINGLLALAPPAQPGQSSPPVWTSMVPLVLLVVVFYFALIRPQQKKAKDHAELLKTVRPGDKVVTTGGVVAVVVTVKEKTVMVRSADSKFEVTKAAIGEITERSGEASES